jgi:hypothetical protein
MEAWAFAYPEKVEEVEAIFSLHPALAYRESKAEFAEHLLEWEPLPV